VVRRRLVVKRIDPWSVLKFGAVANVVLLAIFLLVAGVVWYIVDRLQLVDQACGIATDVGFTSCGVDAGNLFQALALLGALWTVVQTAVLVFLAFLHNLIADLTGGLAIGVIEEGGTRTEVRPSATSGAARTGDARATPTAASSWPVAGGSSAVRAEDQARSSASDRTAQQPPVDRRSGDELFEERR
jgi:hypothetical protein